MKDARSEKRAEITAESSLTGEGDVTDMSVLLNTPGEALDADDENVDPSFDLETSLTSDHEYFVEKFCEEWVLQLDHDDKVSLGLFLAFQLSRHLGLGKTKSAELAGIMIGRSDKVIREWRAYFLNNDGEIPESKHGKYQRSGVVWCNEELNKKATRHIRCNNMVKGRPS